MKTIEKISIKLINFFLQVVALVLLLIRSAFALIKYIATDFDELLTKWANKCFELANRSNNNNEKK